VDFPGLQVVAFSVPVGQLLKREKRHAYVGGRCQKMWLALLQLSLEMGGFYGLHMEMKGRLDGLFFFICNKTR